MATSPPAVRDAGPGPPGRADHNPPARRRTWPAVALSATAVAGLFTMVFLRNHRFAYLDDRQADGVAKLVDMGRILQSGEWPWLSTNVVNSGGYAVEYQNGVFNPVNLGFGVLMGQLEDAALASFLHLLAHLLLLTAAAAWLGRLVGLTTPWAVAFAVSVGFQPYTVFWGAAWYQAIVSFSWFVLAVAAAVALHLTGRQRNGWVLLLATFLCYQSGWPLAIPVLGVFVGSLVLARLVTGCARGATAWIAAWYAGGTTASLVGLYPLVLSFEFASRSSSISNGSNFNVAPLEGLVHAADPAYRGWFTNFGGYALQDLPHFYVAWFLLPVLVFWRPPVSVSPHVRALGIATVGLLVVTALGALGPERVLVFRFPTRFLQYSGFFLLLAAALLVAHGTFTFTRRRLAVLGGVLLVQVVNSLQADPDGPGRIVGVSAVAGVLCLALVLTRVAGPPAGRWRPPAWIASRRTSDAVVALGTVAVLAVVGYLHPMARGLDWGFPHDLTTVEPLSREDYTLWFGNYPPLVAPDELPSPADDVAGFYDEYRASSMGLLVGERQVNGYSPLAHRFLREHLPIDDQGNFGDTGAELFAAEDPATGLTWLELLRVDQVITLLGPRDALLQGTLDESWRRVEEGRHTATYRRGAYDLPGLLSYAAPGVEVGPGEACPLRHSRECVDVAVTGAGDEPSRVVFARLWFPGYSATLDGTPVDVVRHDDTLVAVDLPAGRSGELVLSYRSPGFVPLVALAVAVVVGLGVAQVVQHRRGRPATTGEEVALPAGGGTRADADPGTGGRSTDRVASRVDRRGAGDSRYRS